MLEQTLKALDEEMGKRQKQVVELEMKYNLNPNNKQAELVQWFSRQTLTKAKSSLCDSVFYCALVIESMYLMNEIWKFLNFLIIELKMRTYDKRYNLVFE